MHMQYARDLKNLISLKRVPISTIKTNKNGHELQSIQLYFILHQIVIRFRMSKQNSDRHPPHLSAALRSTFLIPCVPPASHPPKASFSMD